MLIVQTICRVRAEVLPTLDYDALGGGASMICQTQECQSYANLAVDVLKNQEQPLGKSLKNFLSTLPKTDLSTDILTTALLQFAESDPATCRWAIWILQNSDEFQPYFHLMEESLGLIGKRLENQGICLT